jgi:branched-chain amino acid transport system substrate-binding protein
VTGRIDRTRLCAVLSALAVTVGVAACGSSSNSSPASNAAATQSSTASGTATGAASGTPFKVLGFYPLSGPFALPGAEELAGLKAAANVINSEGGILGHKVVLKIDNDQGVGTTAASLAQQEIASGTQYNFVVPGINGAESIPLVAEFARTPVLQISPGNETQLNAPSKYPNFFMSLNDFGANEQGVVNELKAKGITKAGFISGDDPDGQNAAQAFATAAKAAGIAVTSSVLVPDTAVDAKPQLQQVLSSSPQAVVIGAFSNAEPVILGARVALANATPFYLDSFAGAFPLEVPLKTAAAMKGITVEQFPYLVKGNSAQKTSWFKTFLAAYSALIPHPQLNLISGVVSYNALMLARAAAEKAGSVDGAAMIRAMNEISSSSQVPDFVGGTSTGIFTPSNHSLQVNPSNYGFYPAGPTLAGQFVPGK